MKITRSQSSLISSTEWVGIYAYPSKGRHYYRLQWGQGRQVLGQIHIPGGRVGNAIADRRAAILSRLIKQGDSLEALQRQVRKWARRRRSGPSA
ncbi:MAG: hypothetical protein AAGH78_00695 [Cyanobacteria bacterium P01_H01_bin.58]